MCSTASLKGRWGRLAARIAGLLRVLLMLASSSIAQAEAARGKLVGMYVHQHWPYHHPYAARTWTLEDWQGYADGLHRLGYNAVLIWPVLETMPEPLTASDRANLGKIARVIDMLHREFGMRAYITLCPNIIAKDQAALRASFQERHFFYCDARVDPGDPVAMDRLLQRRAKLLEPLKHMDGLAIIDSDPGGYPGSNNEQFANLLLAHRKLLDQLRPGIELIYWMHVGWLGYGRFYETGKLSFSTEAEQIDILARLKALNPEPWGIANGLDFARKLGLADRVISFNYGRIEGEPSFPMCNFGGRSAYEGGAQPGPRGVMGNAQTHCIQLPNTFAFARGAAGQPVSEAEYVAFAEDLIPGLGETIVRTWKVLASSDAAAMRVCAAELNSLPTERLRPGPLKGLLFGAPHRFVHDLAMMLRVRAGFAALRAAVQQGIPLTRPLGEFVVAATAWQRQHGYENTWWWPNLDEVLRRLDAPEINAVLDTRFNPFADPKFLPGETPFQYVARKLAEEESNTPRLLKAVEDTWKRMSQRSAQFSKPWQVHQPQAVLRAAWRKLQELEIPGVPLDQHFRLKGEGFYVSPSGNDTAEGSKAHPWRTLRYAATQLRPGTVIYLMAGTYYGPVEIRTKATEQSPAALRAVAGQEVIVTYDDAFIGQQQSRIARLGKEGAVGADGKELHYPSLITLTGSYVEVSGLHLVGVRDRLPMNLYSESGLSIAGGGGLGCRVLDNEIENTSHCGVKEMGHGGGGFLVEGNYIHDLGLTAHDHAIYLPANDVTVRRNLLLNTTGWGVHAYTEPKRLVISHNVIGGNAEDAVILGGSDCRVLNNVFYGDRKGGVFLFRRGCRNNAVANNIILEPTAFRFDSAGSAAPADQPHGNALDYNCIIGSPSAASGLNPLSVHNVLSEPGLVDAERLDFRLRPGSPCLDAGDPKLAGYYCGQARDIGLYEAEGLRAYSTRFAGSESPLSEGGVWSNQGLDWTQIRKQGGLACSTQTGTNSGSYKFDDSFAHLSGFPPNQEAWGQVRIAKTNAPCIQEVEILLRFTSVPHRATGYECFARCVQNGSSYLQVVRWDGPLGKFTYLADQRGPDYGLRDGDTLKASIVGNVITVYVNGVEKARVKDDTFKEGNPGIGEFLACENGRGVGSNSDFGFSSFTARALGAAR